MNKFDRIISLLVLLQTKKVITAKVISQRYETSLRTVYRDISTLRNAGIPIIGDPGIGYSIVEGFRLPPITFNEAEVAALLTAEKFIGKITDKDIQEYYSNAMMKIKAILRSSEKQSLSVLDESIAISDYYGLDEKSHLQEVFRSIASKNILSIAYQKSDGSVSNRTIEPVGCYHQFNNWYLMAYCQSKNDYRTFKLNRISQLQILHDCYDTQHISLQEFIDRQNQFLKENDRFHPIEIAFKQEVVQHAERRKMYFGFVDQAKHGDAIHMKFLYSSIEIMARWLMQFADQATVIAPIELQTRMRDLAHQTYSHYHKNIPSQKHADIQLS